MTAAVATVVSPLSRNATTPPEIRLNILFPRGVAADFAQLAISPDGQQIVVAPNFGAQQPSPLWLRPLASTSGRLLTGTEGSAFPFWSPGGRSIGFFADQKLKASRRQQRGDSNPRQCTRRARRRLAARRHDSVRAERSGSAVSSKVDGWPANRRHPARGWTERLSSAAHPTRRETLHLDFEPRSTAAS
jgi:hypothetical protein